MDNREKGKGMKEDKGNDKKKVLEIYRGDEYRTKIERNFEEKDIFEEVFNRADEILCEIIEEEKQFCKEQKEQRGFSGGFQGMGNNIIVFCADRGQGKTSAMLSFAKELKNPSKKKEKLAEERKTIAKQLENYFYVLDPVDPSILDGKESLIRVVISRLFYNLSQLVEKEKFEKTNDFRRDKDKILRLFQQCYDNIDYLQNKNNKMEYQDDLEYLAQLGDSSKLKENLYELIDTFLDMVKPREEKKEHFLVIPVDDADLSVSSVFHICEDIRKFLSIPNVIVLIAANFEQLNWAILQNYLLQYEVMTKLQKNITMEKECQRMATKYLEKMFPSGHRLELPKIEYMMLKRSYSLTVSYIIDDKDVFESISIGCIDLQEQLLKLIYMKTGVVVLKEEGQLAPFLPRTLRELTHFIKLFYNMKDVDLGIAYQKVNILKETENELKINTELKKLRENLQLLKQYFFYYWCLKKLTLSEQKEIVELEDLEQDNLKETIKTKLKHSGEVQVAIKLYYTIFINEWFAEALEDKKQLEKIKEFVVDVLETPECLESKQIPKKENISGTEVQGYLVDNFELDYEKVKVHFKGGKADKKGLDLLEHCCSFEFKNGYRGTKELISKDGDWNEGISKIQFRILKPVISLITGELVENKEVSQILVKEEGTLKDIKLEELSQGITIKDQLSEYIKYVKDVISVHDLWNQINSEIEIKFYEFKHKKRSLQWKQMCYEIYNTLDSILNNQLKYLHIDSLVGKIIKDNLFLISKAEKLFLCNNNNLNKYIKAYEKAFDGWISKIQEVLASLESREQITRDEWANIISPLKKMHADNFTQELIVTLTPEIESIVIGEEGILREKQVRDEIQNIENGIVGLLEKSEKEKEKSEQEEEKPAQEIKYLEQRNDIIKDVRSKLVDIRKSTPVIEKTLSLNNQKE